MTGNRIVQIAKIEIGYVEKAGNITKYGEWFGMNGTAWCGIFVSWVYAQAGKPLGKIDYLKGFAGCQYALRHFHKLGKVVEIPEAGDIYFLLNSKGVPFHTGIFAAPLAQTGKFEGIEGNTSLASDHNGGSVMARTRAYDKCVFVRL